MGQEGGVRERKREGKGSFHSSSQRKYTSFVSGGEKGYRQYRGEGGRNRDRDSSGGGAGEKKNTPII